MLRLVLNLLTVFSLLLLAAAASLWVRSYRTAFAVAKFDPGSGGASATVARGVVALS